MKPGQELAYLASWQKLLAALKLLDDSGIRLVPGTDNAPGFMLHSELEAWALAGIPRARVLQLATLGSARHFGQEQQVGSMEVGKAADMLFVSGDPTQDLGLLRRARAVLKGGDLYLPSETHALMGIAPFASPPPLQ